MWGSSQPVRLLGEDAQLRVFVGCRRVENRHVNQASHEAVGVDRAARFVERLLDRVLDPLRREEIARWIVVQRLPRGGPARTTVRAYVLQASGA